MRLRRYTALLRHARAGYGHWMQSELMPVEIGGLSANAGDKAGNWGQDHRLRK